MTRRFETTVRNQTIVAHADPDRRTGMLELSMVLQRLPPEVLVDGGGIMLDGHAFSFRASEGGLTVHAPDYLGDPFEDTTADLTLALWVMEAQTELLRRFGSPGQPTRWGDKVVVHTGCLEAESVYLHRQPVANEHDSGWYIGPRDGAGGPGVEDLESIRAYELLRRRRTLVPLLALPDDHVVIVVGDEIDGVLGPDDTMLTDLGAQTAPRSP